MAAYSEQVIFCTGKDDWVSNIEQEEGETGEFVRGLKSVIGKGSSGFDVGSFPDCLHLITGGPLITIVLNLAVYKRPYNRILPPSK
jgi:hypothetical protein